MEQLKKLWNEFDLQDRMLVVGGAVMAVFAFFPWFTAKINTGSASGLANNVIDFGAQTHSMSGVGVWHGWMAVIFGAATVATLLAPQMFASVKQPLRGFLPLISSALGFILGPLAFFSRSESSSGIVEAGTTLWFWIAFLGGLAAVAGAAWKKFGAPATAGGTD